MTYDLLVCRAAPPLPPEGLHAVAQGSSWVQMEWNRDTATPPITGYVLEYRLPFEVPWTSDTIPLPTTIRNLTGLYPLATYQVSVMVMMS